MKRRRRSLRQCYHKIVLQNKRSIMLLLKIVVAGLVLSMLGSLMVLAMVYVEARRGDDLKND